MCRHEKPVDNELAHQSIKDRYHGQNDPVARKIMANHAVAQGLKPPEDQSIVCFRFEPHCPLSILMILDVVVPIIASYICVRSGNTDACRELATQRSFIRAQIGSSCGKVEVRICFMVPPPSADLQPRCAFVNFKDRTSAERAAEAWAHGLDMDGERISVRWGRGKNGGTGSVGTSSTNLPNPPPTVTTTA